MLHIAFGILNLYIAWVNWNHFPRMAGVNLGVGIMTTAIGATILFVK